MNIQTLDLLKGLALLARDLRARGLTEREIAVTDQWREICRANQEDPLALVEFARPPLIQEWLTERSGYQSFPDWFATTKGEAS